MRREALALAWEAHQQLLHHDPVRLPHVLASPLIVAPLQSGKAVFCRIGQAVQPQHMAGIGFALQSSRDNHQEQS